MITSDQMRAARALLDWSYDTLAKKTGLTRQGLTKIANGETTPHSSNTNKIISVFESHGIEFMQGGARKNPNLITEYEGSDCYLRLLDDILSEKPEEVLFSGSDESLSPKTVIDKNIEIAQSGIKIRSLIKNQDTYVMGPLDTYRWMPEGLFVEGDVKVVFNDFTAYSISQPNEQAAFRVIKFRHSYMAEDNRRLFNLIWNNAKGPLKSSSEVRYD